MTDVAPRCPFCANVIKIQPSFWARLGLKPARAACPTCRRECEARDAHTMGSSFFYWAEQFRSQLTKALDAVPILPEHAMHRALGNPHKDDTRLISSLDELVRACLRHHRTPIIERARGREALLEVVHLHNETSATIEVVAILGTSSSESGAKEWQQLIARIGTSHFVLYTYPGTDGAEPRVKRAVHAQSSAPKIATNPQTVAALHATRTPASTPQHARHR